MFFVGHFMIIETQQITSIIEKDGIANNIISTIFICNIDLIQIKKAKQVKTKKAANWLIFNRC